MEDNKKELTERKKVILRAVVDAHIKGGEPVGSKSITQNTDITCSSATIRNEMAELEEMGYLTQPHSSAGRVPTESGYRYYVKSLMQKYKMTVDEIEELNRLTKVKMSELDRIMAAAGKLMGTLTNYSTMTYKSNPSNILIMDFRSMKMSERVFLLIMVTNADVAQTRHMHTGFDISSDMLSRLDMVLNTYVAGKACEEITLPLIVEMERKMGEEGAPLIQAVVKCIYEVCESGMGDLKFEGVSRLLQYPEYNDMVKFRNLLGVIEEHKDELANVVSNASHDETNIYIGSDIKVAPQSSSTLIFKTLTQDGKVVGAIGVLGPCRMDYSKVVSTVDYLSDAIHSMIRPPQLEDKKKETGDK